MAEKGGRGKKSTFYTQFAAQHSFFYKYKNYNTFKYKSKYVSFKAKYKQETLKRTNTYYINKYFFIQLFNNTYLLTELHTLIYTYAPKCKCYVSISINAKFGYFVVQLLVTH